MDDESLGAAPAPVKPAPEEQKKIDTEAKEDALRKGAPQVASAAPAPSGPDSTYGDGSPVFAGFPLTKYHPTFGARTADTPNDAATAFDGPAHNWFATPEQADMARTDREAQQVIHNNLDLKVKDKIAGLNGEPLPSADADRKGIVRNSVQAQERYTAGLPEPI